MSIQNIFLLVAAGINLLMSVLVFSRGVKNNKINLYFSLLTFFNFLWALAEFLIINSAETNLWLVFAKTTYLMGLAIALSLYNFCVYFPYKSIHRIYLTKWIFLSVSVLMTLFIFYPGRFILDAVIDSSAQTYRLYFNNSLYILYTLIFLLIVIASVAELISKYKNTEGVLRYQTAGLLVVILVGLIFGFYFDIFLPYFQNFQYVWLAKISTVFMNFLVFYFIFLSRVRVINK